MFGATAKEQTTLKAELLLKASMQERANNPTIKSEFDILQLLPRVANDNQVPCWYCPKYSKGTKKNHS